MTLYDLQDQYRQLYDMMADGDIDEQTLSDTMEAMNWTEEFESKADGYAKIIRQFLCDAEAAKPESDRLAQRKKMFESRAEMLKSRLYDAMKTTGKEKFKTPFASYLIQKNPKALKIDDELAIPDNFFIVKREPDKRAIKDYLSDATVPWAHLEQGESLRIR